MQDTGAGQVQNYFTEKNLVSVVITWENVAKGSKVSFEDPEGRPFEFTIRKMMNPGMLEIHEAKKGDFVLIEVSRPVKPNSPMIKIS